MIFKMSKNNEQYAFIYCGMIKYKPNKSSTSGYGSDVWFYLCEFQGNKCLLVFSDDAGYGTIWEYSQLNDDEAKKLENAELDLWVQIYFQAKKRNNIFGLHLENIDEVRAILPERSRCYKFSNMHYYGQY